MCQARYQGILRRTVEHPSQNIVFHILKECQILERQAVSFKYKEGLASYCAATRNARLA